MSKEVQKPFINCIYLMPQKSKCNCQVCWTVCCRVLKPHYIMLVRLDPANGWVEELERKKKSDAAGDSQ